MKITAFFHAILIKDKIILKPTDSKDWFIINKIFRSKDEREKRLNQEIMFECTLDALYSKRTFKQLRAVFKLVTVIFQCDSEDHRKPTEEEKKELYYQLLDVYGVKKPNPYNNNSLISIPLSEQNTIECATFIDNLLYHLSSQCNLTIDLQATVRDVLYKWEIWRGEQDEDINDYRTPEELREKVVYSEASGRQPVELHHIMTRGANPLAIDKAWNLVALTSDEHRYFHDKGWDAFLMKFPHLRGKFERAARKAAELKQNSSSTSLELAQAALS